MTRISPHPAPRHRHRHRHRNLDAAAIDEIADGLEQMLLSWSGDLPPPPSPPPKAPTRPAPFVNSLAAKPAHGLFHAGTCTPRGQLPQRITEFNLIVSRDVSCRPNASTTRPTIEEVTELSCLNIADDTAPLLQEGHFVAPAIEALPMVEAKHADQENQDEDEKEATENVKDGLIRTWNSMPHSMEDKNVEIAPTPDKEKLQSMQLASNFGGRFDGNNCDEQGSVVRETITYQIKTNGSDNWRETVQFNGSNGSNEFMENKLALLGNCVTSFPALEGNDHSAKEYKQKVDELEVALLECAMEYEVKILEMKMKMQKMKMDTQETHSEAIAGKVLKDVKCAPVSTHSEKTNEQRVIHLRKQLYKSQREKNVLSRELNDLQKRERLFELQRKTLEDVLNQVNSLQREVVKRGEEIVECQLREKEVRAQLYEVQMALQKLQASQVEPSRLLSLLPSLREWLQVVKKGHRLESIFPEPQHEKLAHSEVVGGIAVSVTKEIQALQKALSKLTSRK